MRSYLQHCGLARALDLVGDRWTLLVVRDLLVGPARYSDLLDSLPGIATNLLASRLQALERNGIVVRLDDGGRESARRFALTPRGEALEGVIAAFGLWSAPIMGRPGKRDTTRARWLACPAYLYLRDATPRRGDATLVLRSTGDETIVLATTGTDRLRVRVGDAPAADLTLEGPARVAFGALLGWCTLAAARSEGLRVRGDVSLLRRFVRASNNPAHERAG